MTPIPTLPESEVQSDADAGIGALRTDRGNLPLTAVDVRARIDGLIARTLVRQTFVNSFAEPLEATYIFPLPDRAAVTRFRLKVAGRVVEGELQERSKARETYEKAIESGHRAAIAEEERPNVFTMRVGNVPPGETAAVELTLTGPLPVDSGEATFCFPLVVAPRYIPGSPLPGASVGDGTEPDTDAVPDASRITSPVLLPGYPNPVRLSLSVDVHPGGLNARDFRSSLHTLQDASDKETLRFRLDPGERLDRDFIFRFRFDDADIRTALQLQPDTDNPTAGTFALTVVPPHDSAARQTPRDVVFVLDRSGSMEGWKMLAARRALGRMIDTLTAGDRFAVLAFDDRIDPFPTTGLTDATDRQRFRAVEFLAAVNARGGTELAAPLEQGIARLTAAARDRVLVLLTDGQVGNEDQILKMLANRLKGIRVFTLGIDQAVNDGFLKRFAGLGGGYTELVESEDRLDAVMDKVHRRIASPLLTAVKVEPAGLTFEPGTLVPDRLPDLFPGAPLTIMGRYQQSKTRSASEGLCIQANDDAGRPWTATVSATRGEVLAPVWARGHVRALEDRYATGRGNHAELEKQIVATSLKFGVLCRFTAFVAVDVMEVVNEGGEVRRVTQPVDAPAGWDMFEQNEESYCAAALLPTMAAAPRRRAAAPPTAPAPAYFAEDVDAMAVDFDEADEGAPPPPAPKKKKKLHATPGALGRMARSLLGRAPSPTGPPNDAKAIAPDLTAYRQRAAELLRRLEGATDRVRELGVLSVKLEELLDDLNSIGVPEPDCKPLADLLTELRTFLTNSSPAAADVAHMGRRCDDVLTAFATGAAPRRKAKFWA